MRLLIDENYPLEAARALADMGHDILRVADAAPSADDRAVLAMARQQARVLVTFDSDFGELIYLHGEPAPPAAILLRLHPIIIDDVIASTLRALAAGPEGAFVVTGRDGLRRRPLP
jgi:predicted nuclease of predicted toxin-antitoxin system